MTPEEINKTIAEHCGWTFSPPFTDRVYSDKEKSEAVFCWVKPGGDPWQTQRIPNYHGDLNAIHEAEKTLPDDDDREYREILQDACGIYSFHRATATQRAEAFLRTIGKWQE